MKCWRIKNKIFKLILFSNFIFGYFIQNELIAYELITEYNHEISFNNITCSNLCVYQAIHYHIFEYN